MLPRPAGLPRFPALDTLTVLVPVTHMWCSIPDADWAGLLAARSSSSSSGGSGSSGTAFQAVLINTGWECEGRGDAAVQVRWPCGVVI